MTEQLAFSEGFRQCGAVHVHQNPIPSSGQLVQPVREQFFADPGFPGQQDGELRIGDDGQLMQNLVDGIALSDDSAILEQRRVRQRV